MTAAIAISKGHDTYRRAIVAHFAGRAAPKAEATMRAHLLTCAPCTRYYTRHLTIARLDPDALEPPDRIARGLGLGVRARRWRAQLFLGLAVPIAAAGLLTFWPASKVDSLVESGGGASFAVRGRQASAPVAAAVWAYRLGANGRPVLADRTIHLTDELAFAYSNPSGMRFLMIFGVDEHRNVYWFHPAWPSGSPTPAAIRAAPGPAPHELLEAIRHSFHGRSLTISAVFSERAIEVTKIEDVVRTTPAASLPSALGEGVVTVQRVFEVVP